MEYGCPCGGINKMVIHARDIVSCRQESIACERKEESFGTGWAGSKVCVKGKKGRE